MSFLALLEALEPQVGRRLARMVGPEAAEDLRQELLLRAWRSAPRELDEAGFVERFREARAAALAAALVVMDAEDPLEPYLTWLTGRGARVEVLDRDHGDRQLSIADGLVITGSLGDVHPAHYGEPLRFAAASDAGRDGVDLRVTLAALERGLPILGICRGHQLLNVALGGTLWQDVQQDVQQDGTTRSPHRGGNHGVRTVPDSSIRAWLGSGASVSTEHHQALRRLGRGVRVTSTSPDGVVESIEVAGRPLAVGLQWHPEHQASEQAGTRVGEAFVEGCVRRAAA